VGVIVVEPGAAVLPQPVAAVVPVPTVVLAALPVPTVVVLGELVVVTEPVVFAELHALSATAATTPKASHRWVLGRS
jgi:hypothetical protein